MDPYGSKLFEGETKEDTADLISEYEARVNLRKAERAAEDLLRRDKAMTKQVGVGGRLIWD